MDIPQILIDEEQAFRPEIEDIWDLIDHSPRLEILPEDEELQINYENLIITQNGHMNVQLLLYGGEEVTNRITFFVNHSPVQVNGLDFIEIQMEHRQMALVEVEVELELDELDHFNSFYAIMMTTGDDYHVQDMFKTPTLLLINE